MKKHSLPWQTPFFFNTRKCIPILALCSFIVLFPGHQAGSAAESHTLTIDMALDLASENNPIISVLSEQVKQSEEQLRQARASLYPTVGTELIYQKSGEEPLLPVYSAEGSYLGNARNGFKDTYQAAINFTYLLYSGGAVKNNVHARELALDSVHARADRSRQSVDNGVYSAYYDLQRAKARQEVAEEALSLAREHMREVTLFHENGIVAKNEVLRVQIEVSNSELERIKAINSVEVAWSALERAVGVTLRGNYELPEGIVTMNDLELPENIQEIAFENRPELRVLEKSRLSALALSRAALGERGPKVVFRGETYVADEKFFPDMQDDWKITIAATWDLYDGGASRARSREARAAAAELLYRVEDLKKQIGLEISTALLNLRSSGQRVSVARDQVNSAQEDYRMALRRYRARVGTNLDVLDSRVALINARNQLVDSLYDVFQSRADLLFALGIDSYNVEH
ncbi:MAG: TolC family protein [Synergistales bacterium]|nr:TolC family protein [Synergistales bacterium]